MNNLFLLLQLILLFGNFNPFSSIILYCKENYKKYESTENTIEYIHKGPFEFRALDFAIFFLNFDASRFFPNIFESYFTTDNFNRLFSTIDNIILKILIVVNNLCTLIG